MPDDNFPAFINYISKTAWIDLAQLCLLPEILPHLFHAYHMTYANLYYSPSQVCKMIVRAIILCFKRHENKRDWINSVNLILYIGKHPSMRKVLSMWAKYVHVATGDIELKSIIRKIRCSSSSISNLPSADTCLSMYKEIYDQYGSNGVYNCFTRYRLKISKTPAESVLRISPFRTQKPESSVMDYQLTTLKSAKVLDTLGIIYACPLISEELRVIEGSYIERQTFQVKSKYEDHIFHIYGHLSTAFVKFYQIIASLVISVAGECICLGDGEGGVGRLLLQIGADHVYFNTLMDTSKLVAHRAMSYVPATCIGLADRIQSAVLSTLMGGYLSDDDYIDSFISLLPKTVCLLTCDAEIRDTTPNRVLKIHHNITKVIQATHISHVIVKVYLTNPELVRDIIAVPENIFNVDETGIQLINKPGKVLTAKGAKDVHVITPREKGETISLVACCSAEGRFLPPVIIMKGVNKKSEFSDGLPNGSDVYMNKKSSYINSELFLRWFKEHFLPKIPQTGKIILILDGHTSHSNSIELLDLANENDVIIMYHPKLSYEEEQKRLHELMLECLSENDNDVEVVNDYQEDDSMEDNVGRTGRRFGHGTGSF
ncbi:DDE superfamily endonuclease [Popillia japonica]|uniref:DDE superfamily endonuclease n=1 Tax=Popillia japonica TaxID=7064 RepID=A0AAW1HTH6_POPJA